VAPSPPSPKLLQQTNFLETKNENSQAGRCNKTKERVGSKNDCFHSKKGSTGRKDLSMDYFSVNLMVSNLVRINSPNNELAQANQCLERESDEYPYG